MQKSYPNEVPVATVFSMWWPLAASWLMMGTAVPMISAVLARLAEPKISLAAFGGIVFPISLIIEAPIIMLLSASTALSKDWPSYQLIRRFMMGISFVLTFTHFLLAFTPLYYTVVVGIMDPPAVIIEPARIGLMIMLPWTWTVAYRRLNQGVLIRNGRSKAISVGAIIRISANASVLAIGWAIGTIPGIVVGASGLIAGVIADAVYTGVVVQPVLRNTLRPAALVSPVLTWPAFLNFYWPLALTSLLNLIVTPLGSATISRMPDALNSLAVWPVLTGFLFMWRSIGFAYSEVVVANLDEPGSFFALRRFTLYLMAFAVLGLTFVAVTPVSDFWFVTVSGLGAELATLASVGLWVTLLWPVISILRNTFQAVLVSGRKTRAVTEAVVIFFLLSGVLLVLSTNLNGRLPGLFVALIVFQIGYGSQALWMWLRSRTYLKAVKARDIVLREQFVQEVTNV